MTIAEPGGPTTVGGVSYQSWVAAWRLVDLLVPAEVGKHPVVEVRLEGRSEVDDVEVEYANGSKLHIQAKRRLTEGSIPWVKFLEQARDFTTEAQRVAMLAVGEGDERWDNLKTALKRAEDARNADDFERSCAGRAKEAVDAVSDALGDPGWATLWRVLARTRLESVSEDKLRQRVEKSLPEGSAAAETIASVLAEIATANGMARRVFTAVSLRRELRRRDITLQGPRASLAAYLDGVERELGGVGVADYIRVSAEVGFVWPVLEHPVGDVARDRFAEHRSARGERAEDPRSLLDNDGQKTIVIAGAGYGKSALLEALARRALDTSRVPVIVSLPVYVAASGRGVITWIADDLDDRYSVSAAWTALAARGELCVLFDGLDEVARADRAPVLRRLKEFSSMFPKVPWVMATRDSGAVAIEVDVQERALGPIEDRELERFFEGYLGDGVAASLTAALQIRRSLFDLVQVPLFATMLAGYVQRHGLDYLPQGPQELLNDFVETMLSPHREGVNLVYPPGELREHAGRLALAGVEADRQVWSTRQCRRDLSPCPGPDGVLEDLCRSGVLRRAGSSEWRFVLPSVQEFLAGASLSGQPPEQIANAMLAQATRPWAQTAQFALVDLEDATATVEEVLNFPDDVFGTNLLAVGRAIMWGASVDSGVRTEVGERLAALYLQGSFGSLDLFEILEVAYAREVPAALLEDLRTVGFGSTLQVRLAVAAPDDVLLTALGRAVEDPYGLTWLPEELQERLVTLGAPVAKLVEQSVRQRPMLGALALLRRLSESNYLQFFLERDEVERFPDEVRVALLQAAGRGSEVEDVLVGLLRAGEERVVVLVPAEFWVYPERAQLLSRVLSDPEISPYNRGDLVWCCFQQEHAEWRDPLEELALTCEDLDLKAQILATKACQHDDHAAFLELCELVPAASHVANLCFVTCLGRYEDDAGVAALTKLASADLTDDDRRELGRHLVFPMSYETRPFALDGEAEGLREREHPGTEAALSLVLPLSDRESKDPFARADDLSTIAQLGGTGAAESLPEWVRACWSALPGEDDWERHSTIERAVSSAVWALVDVPFLVELVTESAWNIPARAIEALMILEEPPLERLLGWYNRRIEAGLLGDLEEVVRNAAIRARQRVVQTANGRLCAESWS